MKLFHTSPSEIKEINKSGRFGEFLCFSDDVYVMTAGAYVTYSIEIDDAELIEVGRIFYHEDAEKLSRFVAKVADMLGCSDDEAEDVISQKSSAFDFGGDAEIDWEIQKISAKCAKELGFRGVAMNDEQGACYMIDMLGKEQELKLN